MGKKKILPVLNIAIVGGEGVGKYSLGQQFARGWIAPKESNRSPDAYSPSKDVEVKGQKYNVQVEIVKEFNSVEQIKGCDGIAVVLSVTDKSSYTWASSALAKLREKASVQPSNGVVHEQAGENGAQTPGSGSENTDPSDSTFPVILVGNKVDDAKLDRQVELESGESLSQKFSCLGFFETAAICNADVPKAFNCLLTEIVSNKGGSEDIAKPVNSCCVIV